MALAVSCGSRLKDCSSLGRFPLPSPCVRAIALSSRILLTLRRATMATRSSTPAKQASQRHAYQQRKARAQAKFAAKQEAEARRVEGLPVTQPHAAGIDIGSRSHWVCIGCCTDDRADVIHEFPAHTDGLHQILDYLRQHH